jgi:hypothetical protein
MSVRQSSIPGRNPASSAAMAKLIEKKKEFDAVAALERASALYLQRIEALGDDCEVMAKAGEGASSLLLLLKHAILPAPQCMDRFSNNGLGCSRFSAFSVGVSSNELDLVLQINQWQQGRNKMLRVLQTGSALSAFQWMSFSNRHRNSDVKLQIVMNSIIKIHKTLHRPQRATKRHASCPPVHSSSGGFLVTSTMPFSCISAPRSLALIPASCNSFTNNSLNPR